jgi:Flp pilus assembly pilin Flp
MRERFLTCSTATPIAPNISTPSGQPHHARSSIRSPREKEVKSMLKLFVSMQNRLAELRNEEGQTMAEYGVVLAVITLLVVGTLVFLSDAIVGALEQVIAVL